MYAGSYDIVMEWIDRVQLGADQNGPLSTKYGPSSTHWKLRVPANQANIHIQAYYHIETNLDSDRRLFSNWT